MNYAIYILSVGSVNNGMWQWWDAPEKA